MTKTQHSFPTLLTSFRAKPASQRLKVLMVQRWIVSRPILLQGAMTQVTQLLPQVTSSHAGCKTSLSSQQMLCDEVISIIQHRHQPKLCTAVKDLFIPIQILLPYGHEYKMSGIFKIISDHMQIP